MYFRNFAICLLASTMLTMPVRAESVAVYDASELQIQSEDGHETVYGKDGTAFSGAVVLPDEENRQMTYVYRDGQKNGVAVSRYENGQVELEITYRNGAKNGEEVMFQQDGKPLYKKTFKDNVLDGEYLLFYENGKPKQKSSYENGELNGESDYFDDEGKVIKIENYKKGIKDGVERIIKNNMLVEENNYVNGKLDGVSKKYNEQYLTDEIHYKNGMKEGLHRIYSEDGGIEDIYYEADMKTGESRKFSPTDRKASVTTYLNDQKNGLQMEWSDTGAVKNVAQYSRTPNDPSCQDCRWIAIENYKNDKKDGLCRYYDEIGELASVSYFVEGVELAKTDIAQNPQLNEIFVAYRNGQLNEYAERRNLWYIILWLGLSADKADMIDELNKQMKMFAVKMDEMETYKKVNQTQFEEQNRSLFFGLTPLSYAVNLSAPATMLQKFATSKEAIEEVNPRGTTALQEAVRLNNLNMVKYLLLNHADVKKVYAGGNTILLFAFKEKVQLPIIEALIKAGADVNAQDKQGNNMLLYALKENEPVSVIRALLEAGADVNSRDKYGVSAFLLAMQRQDAELMNLFIEFHANLNDSAPDGGNLFDYAYTHHAPQEILQMILQTGVDVNQADKNGQLLIIKALAAEDYEMVKTLLKHGADINLTNAEQESALTYVLTHQVPPEIEDMILGQVHDYMSNLPKINLPMWKILLADNRVDLLKNVFTSIDLTQPDLNGEIPLKAVLTSEVSLEVMDLALQNVKNIEDGYMWDAVYRKDAKALAALAKHGGNVNSRDAQKDTLLIYMAKNNADMALIEAIETPALIVDDADIDGHTAMHAAIKNNNVALVRNLLEHKADPNFKVDDKVYLTDLTDEQTDIMELLLHYGAKLDYVDLDGHNLLEQGVLHLNADLVDKALKAGLDPQKKDFEGNNALLMLAEAVEKNAETMGDSMAQKVEQIVILLAGANVDINTQNADGETLLIRLAKKKVPFYKDIAEALERQGINSELKDQYNKTAADYAAENK